MTTPPPSRNTGRAPAPAFDVPIEESLGYVTTGAEIAAALVSHLHRIATAPPRLTRTGVAAIDRDLTIAPSTVTAILGRPSMGKSVLLKAIVSLEIARLREERRNRASEGVKRGDDPYIAYVNLEEPELKLAIQLSPNLPFTWREFNRGEAVVNDRALEASQRTAQFLEDVRVIRHPGMVNGRIAPRLSARRVLSAVEATTHENFGRKPSLVVIDYLQLLRGEGTRVSEGSKTEHVMEASEGAMLISRSLDVPVIMAVQARRETDGQKGEIPLPGLGDAMWSAQIEQDVDNIIGVVRPMAIQGMREKIANEGSQTLAFGGKSYNLSQYSGDTLYFVGIAKSRNDDAIGRRYAFHVHPDTFDVYSDGEHVG